MLPKQKDEIEVKYKQVRLIYVLIIVSVFMYAIVVELTKKNPAFLSRTQPTVDITILRYVLYALSIATFFTIKVLRNYLLSNKGQSSFRKPMSAAAKLAPIDIMTAALCETSAIYGLVLFFIERQSDDFYILMVLSLIYFAVYFPRLSNWVEWARKNETGARV